MDIKPFGTCVHGGKIKQVVQALKQAGCTELT